MINQRLYPDLILGFGNASQTVARYGCFECSLLNGLLKRGYTFTVAQWNQYLKDHGSFDGTLLAASKIAATCPDIFLEGRNEAWNDAKLKAYLADKNYIVLGEVSAKGIGGTGQHFVEIDHCDFTADGKVSMSYVDDPWDGLEDQKITNRYNAYGNILSFRVFKIKQGGQMPGTITVNQSDWDRLLKASQLGDKLIQGLGVAGNIADKDENQINLLVAKCKQIETDKNNAQTDAKAKQLLLDKVPAQIQAAHDVGFQEGVASVPSTNPPQNGAPVNMANYEENGLAVETTIGNTKYITNYKKVK